MNTEVMKEILAYIDSHIYEKISLVKLAEIAGYSPFYFSKLFSEIMGMPITGYIRIRKLQYALGSLLLEYIQMGDFLQCGMQTVNSLCESLQINVYRDGKCYCQDYVRGIAQHDVACCEMEHSPGTEIILKPDSLIFGDAIFSVDMIREWVAENNMTEAIVRVKKQE